MSVKLFFEIQNNVKLKDETPQIRKEPLEL